MKRKMEQKQMDWNKEFLTDEWNYCIQLIKQQIDEVNGYTLENHKGLSEQHQFMSIVRHIVGKGMYLYRLEDTKPIHRELVESSFSTLHNVFDTMEQD